MCTNASVYTRKNVCVDVYVTECISKLEPTHSGYMMTHGESALLHIIAHMKACSKCCVAKANCVCVCVCVGVFFFGGGGHVLFSTHSTPMFICG